jgi:hypothetical protein
MFENEEKVAAAPFRGGHKGLKSPIFAMTQNSDNQRIAMRIKNNDNIITNNDITHYRDILICCVYVCRGEAVGGMQFSAACRMQIMQG